MICLHTTYYYSRVEKGSPASRSPLQNNVRIALLDSRRTNDVLRFASIRRTSHYSHQIFSIKLAYPFAWNYPCLNYGNLDKRQQYANKQHHDMEQVFAFPHLLFRQTVVSSLHTFPSFQWPFHNTNAIINCWSFVKISSSKDSSKQKDKPVLPSPRPSWQKSDGSSVKCGGYHSTSFVRLLSSKARCFAKLLYSGIVVRSM